MRNRFTEKLMEQVASEKAVLFLRFVFGFSMMLHGYPKIVGGTQKWAALGRAMENLGIGFLPEFWGFLASAAEFFGGMALALGLLTKVSAASIAFTMLVAALFHIMKGDSFVGKVLHPLEVFAVSWYFLMSGGGKYSLDTLLSKRLQR